MTVCVPSGLEGLSELRVLDLGANRIRKMEGLEGCHALRELWLGKNKARLVLLTIHACLSAPRGLA